MALETIQHQLQHTKHIDPPRQPFEIEIIWLYEKYKYRIPNTDPLKKSQYTLPPDILNQIITTFKITTSYFSSLVTCPTKINNFYSPFQRDSIFGSHGPTYTHKWQNIGYAHPRKTKYIHKAIHWAQLAAQENHDTITILTIPDEEWTTNETPYKTKFEDTHVSIHFTPDTITYTEPTIPLELNKEPRIEPLAIRILCIHHKNTEIDIEDLETKLLQITTNLQISPPYIKTPPPIPENVKVHKHPKWNKTLYPTHLHQTTPPQLPSFPQTQYKKLLPQYCYYIDGSFTPPKKLTKEIWEATRAGYGNWNPLLKINISKRLVGLQNILRAEISAIHHTLLTLTQEFLHEPVHIFTDSLNSLYLINTQINIQHNKTTIQIKLY
jgi:hypothetical protein